MSTRIAFVKTADIDAEAVLDLALPTGARVVFERVAHSTLVAIYATDRDAVDQIMATLNLYWPDAMLTVVASPS